MHFREGYKIIQLGKAGMTVWFPISTVQPSQHCTTH